MDINYQEKIRITKSAPFILSHVLFERYSTGGVESILLLFLNLKLGYDKDSSTAIYHSYAFLAFSFSIVGSIIADNWWGQFKTLFWMSLVFAAGGMIIAIGSVDALHLPIIAFSIIGLVVITIGSGCIKPCSVTFGGNQYEPFELKSIALFFSLSYFVFNCGSIVSRIVNPILREDVKCFNDDDCYPLAFGIPGALMCIAALSLLAGKKYSVCLEATGNTLLNVFGCIWHALSTKLKFGRKASESRTHWLDYAEEKYGKTMVMETKMILNVLVLFIPMPLFWALFDQQYSRWVFQATRMNGDLGFFTIKPDQFSVINPLMVLILIPTFEYAFYPLIARIGIKTPLQKATLGGVLGAVSFVISAIVETQINTNFIHMAWLAPQFFIMTCGEMLFSVPMMEFSHTEAPDSMKSALQAFRLLTVAGGNLIVVIVAGAKLIESQVYEFLLFAALMIVDMGIFWLLARRFKHVDQDQEIENIENQNKEFLIKRSSDVFC